MTPALHVRDLMTAPALALRPLDDLTAALDLMAERHIRHIPIVDGEHDLVGLVSHRDVLRNCLTEQPDVPSFAERPLIEKLKIRDIMTVDVETAAPDTALAEAAGIMLENKFGCLPVVEGWRVVGILTESDFVKYFTGGAPANGNGRPN